MVADPSAAAVRDRLPAPGPVGWLQVGAAAVVLAHVPVVASMDPVFVDNFIVYAAVVAVHHRILEPIRRVTPGERLYVSGALTLHVVGVSYGFYGTVGWFDVVTHTLSGSLVAALLLVLLRPVTAEDRVRYLLVVAGVVVAGLGWEMYELSQPALEVYGFSDSVQDQVANLVGTAGAIVHDAARDRRRGPLER